MNNQRKLVGILGGSFNPPHLGHLAVAKLAMLELGLDELWILVSPQNPLKPREGMAEFDDRFAMTKLLVAGEDNIIASDIEQKLGWGHTYRTLNHLKAQHPTIDFVWLMGSDNLASFHQWAHWQEIITTTRIAVFRRGDHADAALNSDAAHFAKDLQRDMPSELRGAVGWCMLRNQANDISSTQIRTDLSAGRRPAALSDAVYDYLLQRRLYGTAQDKANRAAPPQPRS